MNVLAANPLNQQDLCTDYTEWFNEKFPIAPEEPPACTSSDWDTPGEKIEKINDFLKDPKYSKWALSCCWNSGNLVPNMQLELCTKTDFNHDGKFIPSSTCDSYMTAYCSGTGPHIQEDICGCFRTDIADNKFDEVLFRELSKTNPNLEPKCVMNRCYYPAAYRTQDMQKAKCPNVCAAISSDPNSQTYVAVNCSPTDIIVNKIGDIINPPTQSALRSDSLTSPSPGKPYYKTTTFYVLLVAIIILSLLLAVKIWKKRS